MSNVIKPYKKSFISQVICRIDFLDNFEDYQVFSPDVINKINKLFVNKEKDQIIRFNVIKVEGNSKDLTPNISNNYNEGIQQTFTTSDQKNKIILSNKYLIAEFNAYETFNVLYDSMDSILNSLANIRRNTVVRTGLRFINTFDTAKEKIFKKYFIPTVGNALDIIIKDKDNNLLPIRSMHLAEYKVDNLNLNFRFGLYNKSYPDKIRSNDFILDYDCYTTEKLENVRDVLYTIKKGHDSIQYLFEHTITDSLRQVMNND